MAAKYLHKDYRVYAILGDGEIQEGQVWEAAESAVKYGLDNFVVLLDHNGLQIDGTNDQVMPVGDPCAKFAAFGFEAVKVDGHDIQAIVDAIQAPVTQVSPFHLLRDREGQGRFLYGKRGRLARQGTQ